MPDCAPCKERGRTTPGDRTVGGEWMCNWCFAGFDGPNDPAIQTKVVMAARALREPSVNSVLKENVMRKKIAIDETKLWELHGQGLSDRAIGEKLGASSTTILTRRRALGLAPGKRGGRAVSGNGTKPRRAPQPKLQRKAAKPAAKASGHIEEVFQQAIAELEFQKQEIDQVIDYLNRQIAR